MAVSLTLVPFTVLGLARFAYGLLLPAMRDDLSWSYAAAGSVTTANAIGYLAGAVAAPWVSGRGSERIVIVGSVTAVAVSLAATGLTGNYPLILLFRFTAGLFGGVAFVAAAAIAVRLSASGVGWALVCYPAGAGAAITLTSVGLPLLLAGQQQRWPTGWFGLAAATACAALVLAASITAPSITPEATRPAVMSASLPRLEAAYGLFGLGYIAYITFVVAYLLDGGAEEAVVTGFWAILGASAVAATAIWPRLLAAANATIGFIAALVVCAAGVAIVIISPATAMALASAVLFGGSFLAVVTTVTSAARDALPAPAWPTAVARLTIAFSIGQILGPVLAGLLGDSTAGLKLGLILSTAALLAATAVALIHLRESPQIATPTTQPHGSQNPPC